MNDADPKLSRRILIQASLGAALNLVDTARTAGPRRAAGLFALGVGLPAAGEILATGPLRLLRHRTRPRIFGVPVAILLGWYCAINGSLSVAENALGVLPVESATRERLLAPAAALVGTGLDLALDPVGLEAGLWEWSGDGLYAREVEGPNGRRGVPLVNYLGWLLLVGGAVAAHGRLFGRGGRAGRLPGLLLLAPYLAAVARTIKDRRFRHLLLSAPFPLALLASLRGRG